MQATPAPVFHAKLHRPEAVYEVRLTPGLARPLEVWRKGKRLDSYLKRSYKPWALQICDVDGDGLPEIAIGVVRTSKGKPFPHRCLFIMRFDGRHLRKKWMGSSMGRPLREFVFSPGGKGVASKLYTLETTLDNRVALGRWLWNGFGFSKQAGETVFPDASQLRLSSGWLILNSAGKNVMEPASN